MAYDKYGHLDQLRFQLLTRGAFLSQEEAAVLPTRLSLPGQTSAGGSSRAPQARLQDTPRGRRINTTITGDLSDRGAWTDEDIEVLVRLHAQRVPFPEIVVRVYLLGYLVMVFLFENV